MTAGEHGSRDALSEGAGAAGESIETSLRAVRELLGMDIAWIAEFRHGQKIFRVVDGDGASFGFCAGDAMPLDQSYCQRVVRGAIPNVIQDTASEPGVCDLEVTATARIGSYMAVPIQRIDGAIYGTLCVASHGPSGVTEPDVEFLHRLARRIAADLEAIWTGTADG